MNILKGWTSLRMAVVLAPLLSLTACVGAGVPNGGKLEIYNSPTLEADWIRNGEPIEFENQLWEPVDSIENLLDSEVYILGEHRGVQFFIEKIDVRPYNRLYTKFDRNRYRSFQPRKE